jgi:hypothetical protein
MRLFVGDDWAEDHHDVEVMDDIHRARAAVDDYAAWYAPTVLGGPLDQWAEVATAGQLDAWLEQHPHSVIALFSRFATAAAGCTASGMAARTSSVASSRAMKEPTRTCGAVAEYMLGPLGVPATGLSRTKGIVAWTGPSGY